MTRRRSSGPGQMVGGIQLDLFGQVEAHLDDEAATAAKRAGSRAEFERRARYYPDGTEVRWVAPADFADGKKAGQEYPGWRCWICGEVERNEDLLAINHGMEPVIPATWNTCLHLRMQDVVQQVVVQHEAQKKTPATKRPATKGTRPAPTKKATRPAVTKKAVNTGPKPAPRHPADSGEDR